MKVVIFTEFFEHDKNSAGKHMSDIVMELSNKYYEIDVFSIYEHKITEKKNWPENINIYNLGLSLDAKSNYYFLRFFVELSISARAFIKILQLKKLFYYDRIIWYSPTIFWGPVVLMLNIFKKSKKYLILRDIFPQWAVDLGVIKKISMQNFILSFFEKLQYVAADSIAIQSEGNRLYFNKSKRNKKKLTILKTWYDLDNSEVELPNDIMKKIPFDKKVLLYIGNLGIAQDQTLILNLIKEMKINRDVHFVLIGQKDSDQMNLIKYKDKNSLQNLTVLNPIAQKSVNTICKKSYLGVFALDRRHTTHNIPGKFLQYISCRLPVFGLCGDGDIVDIIKKHNFGKTYLGDKPKEAMEVLLSLIDNIDKKQINTDNMQSYIINNLSTKLAAEQIYDNLESK
jgi:O26-antigen biosynthesis N-acetyl-L-fucosamine transferase